MSSQPSRATLVPRHADPLQPNTPSCGNQPAHISLTARRQRHAHQHRNRTKQRGARPEPSGTGASPCPLTTGHSISVVPAQLADPGGHRRRQSGGPVQGRAHRVGGVAQGEAAPGDRERDPAPSCGVLRRVRRGPQRLPGVVDLAAQGIDWRGRRAVGARVRVLRMAAIGTPSSQAFFGTMQLERSDRQPWAPIGCRGPTRSSNDRCLVHPRRRHSALGNLSPIVYGRHHTPAAAAA